MRIPVRYVVEEREVDVALINNGCSMWKHADYAKSWAQRGRADYQRLIDFSTTNKVSLSVAVSLLDGGGYAGDAGALLRFRNGNFRVREHALENALRVCAIIRAARELRRKTSTVFIRAAALCCWLPDFDGARLRKSIAHCPEKVLSLAGLDATLTMFEDVYNHRQRELFPLRVTVLTAIKESRDLVPPDAELTPQEMREAADRAAWRQEDAARVAEDRRIRTAFDRRLLMEILNKRGGKCSVTLAQVCTGFGKNRMLCASKAGGGFRVTSQGLELGD